MKESMWGVFIVGIGLLGILLMSIFIDISTTNEQNYYLLKESATAAMYESVDLAYYREYGELKISEDKFAENFARRYSESASKLKVYDISLYDIQSLPPKASVKVTSNVAVLPSIGIDTFEVTNTFDIIIEAIKDVTEGDIANVLIEKISAQNLTIYQGEKQQLVYSISPGETTDKNVTFKFIDGSDNCATIDSNGIVTGVEGKYDTVCTRTVQITSGGKSATATVTVKPYISLESIKIVGEATDAEVCANGGVNLLNYLIVTLSNGQTVTGKDFVSNYEEGKNLTVEISPDSATASSHVNEQYFLTTKGIGTISYTFTLGSKTATGKIKSPNCSTKTTTKKTGSSWCGLVLKGSYDLVYPIREKEPKYISNSVLKTVFNIYGDFKGAQKITLRYTAKVSGGETYTASKEYSVNKEEFADNAISFYGEIGNFISGGWPQSSSAGTSVSVSATATGSNGFSCSDSTTINANEIKRKLSITVNPSVVVLDANNNGAFFVKCSYSDGTKPLAPYIEGGGIERKNIAPSGSTIKVTRTDIGRHMICCYAEDAKEKSCTTVKILIKNTSLNDLSCVYEGHNYACTHIIDNEIIGISERYGTLTECYKYCLGKAPPTTTTPTTTTKLCSYKYCVPIGNGKYNCTNPNSSSFGSSFDSCSCKSNCQITTKKKGSCSKVYGPSGFTGEYRCSLTGTQYSTKARCEGNCYK